MVLDYSSAAEIQIYWSRKQLFYFGRFCDIKGLYYKAFYGSNLLRTLRKLEPLTLSVASETVIYVEKDSSLPLPANIELM